MRLRHGTSGAEQVRKAKKEPLTEDIRKGVFSEQELETIRQRRNYLIQQGLTDKAVARELSAETGRTVPALETKIRSMARAGDLEPNPNKNVHTDFTQDDLELIARVRTELILEGKRDSEIARVLSGTLGRSPGSISEKMRHLVEAGQLEQNPAKLRQKNFTPQELRLILERRARLMADGLADFDICVVLSKELGRGRSSLYNKIGKMKAAGKIAPNPHQTRRYGEGMLAALVERREELVTQGLTDHEVARAISDTFDKSASSISSKISGMVRKGELESNPHKHKRVDFTKAELARLARRRAELIGQGLTDREISESASGEMERTACSLYSKLRKMVKNGQLAKNRNEKAHFHASEVALISERRKALMSEGLPDKEISNRLAGELEHPARKIYQKISDMVKLKELPKNDHRVLPFSPGELDVIRRTRGELMAAGMQDQQISVLLAGKLRRTAAAIREKMRKMIHGSELDENPNKAMQAAFSDGEIAHIIMARAAMIMEGRTDGFISRRIADELGRTPTSIVLKIRRMVRSGQLPVNPNAQGRGLSESEVLSQLKEAVSLYTSAD